MHRTLFPAAVKTPHERYAEKQQRCTSDTSRYTAIPPSLVQNQQQQHHYNYHESQHQPQKQQNSHMRLMVHGGSSTNFAIPMLPPHIHSMLYHSIVEPSSDTVKLPGSGGKAGYTNSPANTSVCLRIPTGACEQQHQQEQQQQQQQQQQQRHQYHRYRSHPNSQLCGSSSSSSVHVNLGRRAANTSVSGYDSGSPALEEMHLLQAPMAVTSPWSENTSLGNHTTSPSTAHRYPAMETEKRPHASPVMFSPDPSPYKSDVLSPTIYSTKTLERELFAAGNEELVQMILELSRCNAEAAQFIQTKARLFSLRHAIAPVGKQQERGSGKYSSFSPLQSSSAAPPTAPKTIPTSVVARSQYPSDSMGIMGRCCISVNTTPSKSLTFVDESPLRDDRAKLISAFSAASSNGHAHSRNSAQPLLLTPTNQYLSYTSVEGKSIPNQGEIAATMEADVDAQERAFCSELHPCLTWYKCCRYSAYCPFVSLPRNLCLHWVRGSCTLGRQCCGVHRLPDPCPTDVQTVFALSHGADRSAMGNVALQGQQQIHQMVSQRETTCVEPLFQVRESPTTPREQIMSNPTSIPASLEHYYHGLHFNEGNTLLGLSIRDTDETSTVDCNCRSCCSVASDELHARFEGVPIDHPLLTEQQQQLRENPLLHLSGERPVSRSLYHSFTASAMDVLAVCEAEEDGAGCPPRYALTRTHSPIGV